MASSKALYLFLFASSVAAMNMMGAVWASGSSRDFWVGDDNGWSSPSHDEEFYDHWAQKNGPFHVGDVLHFKYNKSVDSVSHADKEGYYHCHYNGTTVNYTDGNTTITLAAPIIYYFVSFNRGHCEDGLRLLINATSPGDNPSPPPSPFPSRPPVPIRPPEPAPAPSPIPPPASSAVSNQVATWPISLVALAAAAFVFFMPLQL